jgi:alkylation response protein AidB-like acyl-CoA dehydrogenase
MSETGYPTPERLAAYRQEIRAFILGEVEALVNEMERSREVPPDLWARLAARGLLGLTLPPAYGGWGLRLGDYFPILEQVAQSHGSVRMVVHVQNGLWRLLEGHGSPAQKARFLPRWRSGEARLAFALTEPDAGTGADIRTEARRDGDGWMLDGRKWLITFADLAEAFIVVAYTDRARRQDGISAFLVPRDAPGFRIVPQPDGMGLFGTGHGLLELRGCRVPAGALLGREGDGLRMVLRDFLDASRISIAVSCLGLAQRALDLAVAHARRRVTFGKPIAERQAVQLLLAEMALDVQAARLLARDAARRADAGEPFVAEAAMAKLFGLEMVGRVTDRALQVFGGIGYLKTHTIERIYRDARAVRFEEGTAEIQKLLVARHVLDGPGTE